MTIWKNDKGQFHRTDGPAIEYTDGSKAWFQNGKIHRSDGPAVEWKDGNKEWWVNGKLHRTDGPAIDYGDGDKAWYVKGMKYTEEEFNNLSFMTEDGYGNKFWKNSKGQYHRTDGPAIEWKDGSKSWWANGKLHRTGGPAIERQGGDKYWYQNNKFHRTDGPAIDYGNGNKEWWVDNVQYTEEEFNDLSFMTENEYGDKFWKNPKGQYHRTDGPAVEGANGDKSWWVNDKLHRTDGPAIEYADGDKDWWVNGKLHRTDGPAVENVNEGKSWWVDNVQYTKEEFNNLSFMTENSYGDKFWKNPKGELHRTYGPAVEYANGDKSWWVNGKLHRTGDPAIEHQDGTKAWYQNDKLHRTDGPAIDYGDGNKEWWVDNMRYTEEEFNNKYSTREIITVGGKRYLLTPLD